MFLEAGYTPPGGVGTMLPVAANSDGTLMRSPVLVMETDVAAVVAGGPVPGWIGGTPANLAPSTSTSISFDLGPNWHQYVVISLAVLPQGPSSGLGNCSVTGSSTNSVNSARRLNFANSIGQTALYTASIPTASGAAIALLRPQGRYVFASMANVDASNPMGAGSKVTLTAYPS
jgi:hypothetical protein